MISSMPTNISPVGKMLMASSAWPSRQVSASKSRNDSMSVRWARSNARSQKPGRRSPSAARPTLASAASPVVSNSPAAATATHVV